MLEFYDARVELKSKKGFFRQHYELRGIHATSREEAEKKARKHYFDICKNQNMVVSEVKLFPCCQTVDSYEE
ncbi:MAG: hypothetical protein WA061_01775 [Microgenomates group bacterium]